MLDPGFPSGEVNPRGGSPGTLANSVKAKEIGPEGLTPLRPLGSKKIENRMIIKYQEVKNFKIC